MKTYEVRGREIYSDKGKHVASLDDAGNIVMMPGMSGPHAKAVKEYLDALRVEDVDTVEPSEENVTAAPTQNIAEVADVAPESGVADVVAAPESSSATDTAPVNIYVGAIAAQKCGVPAAAKKPLSREEWEISTIPESELPPFSPEYGVFTPGFEDFVRKNNLDEAHIAALVKRLTNK